MLRMSFDNLADRSQGKAMDKETFLQFFPLPGLHGERLFEVFDSNHTGQVDFVEFCTGLAVCVRGTFEEKVDLVFKIYDIDKTTVISRDELRTMLLQVPRATLVEIAAGAASAHEARQALIREEEQLQSQGGSVRAANSAVAMQLVRSIVDCTFERFARSSAAALSRLEFREWVTETPVVLDFLESVFPLDDVSAADELAARHGLPALSVSVGSTSSPSPSPRGNGAGFGFAPPLSPDGRAGRSDSSGSTSSRRSVVNSILGSLGRHRNSSRGSHSGSGGAAAPPAADDAELGAKSPSPRRASLPGYMIPSGSSSSRQQLPVQQQLHDDAEPPPCERSRFNSWGSTDSDNAFAAAAHRPLSPAPVLINVVAGTRSSNVSVSSGAGASSHGSEASGEHEPSSHLEPHLALHHANASQITMAAPAAPDGGNPADGLEEHAGVMSGMLYKVGSRIKTSKTRFFLLRGHTLYYYYPNQLEQPAGIIFLQGCFVAAREGGEGGEGGGAGAGAGGAGAGAGAGAGSPSHGIHYGQHQHHHHHHGGAGAGAGSPKISNPAARALRSEFSEIAFRSAKRAADTEVLGTALSPAHAHLFPFDLITSQGGARDSRTLYAKSEADRQRWIAAIRRASNVVPFESKYHLLEQLGRGKFATVYKCEKLGENDAKPNPLTPDKFYAVKVIDKGKLNDSERELLRTEISVLKLCNHPNIVNMEDVFESLNHIYLVLEHVTGGELFDRIVGRARLKEEQVFPLVKQLAEAVAYLHDMGVAHRDIKPENVLCSGAREEPVWLSTFKICDFGLSKLISPKGVMTLACGTLSYVAPEVLSSDKGYGKAADMWNIGVIFYLVRRGRLPFDGESKDEVVYRTVNEVLDFANDPVFSKSSPEEVAILEGLMHKDPDKRLTAKQVLAHPWLLKMQHRWDTEPELSAAPAATNAAANAASAPPANAAAQDEAGGAATPMGPGTPAPAPGAPTTT